MMGNGSRAEIVIIEDDPSIARFLADLLEMEDYRVATFLDGTTLDAVTAAAPQLILLDLMLPQLDGAEVCRRLRAAPRTRTTPIIIMTAAASTPVAQRLSSCSHDGLLNKPFDIDAVLALAARYVRKPVTPMLMNDAALGEEAW
jgi:two-component system phosphate regulon response regulator PhoB/two-component system alkaline phosphatase synthesis response regulator PhoP